MDVADVRAAMAELTGPDDQAALASIPAVLAFVIADARHKGEDEADAVEGVVLAADMCTVDIRAAARVLARLGYTRAAERLSRTTGRRKPGKASFAARHKTALRISGAMPGHQKHRYRR